MEWHPRAYSISDIWGWNKRKQLELRPDFQRKEVWSKPAQIALIDTILRHIPIPKIYVQSILGDDIENMYRIVVDGQQRLNTILQFLNDKLRLRIPFVDEQFDRLLFTDLPVDVRKKFLTYQLDFNDLVNPTEDEVRDLYARVNKYTVQLNKQELRRADFPGEFISLAEKLADIKFFNEARLFSSGQTRRMLDVEFIEELLCLQLEGEQDKKETIDDFCERYATFPTGTDSVEKDFKSVLNDLAIIFCDEISLAATRFKQKADFYSLFGCIWGYIRNGKILNPEKLPQVRASLLTLHKEIAPHAENEIYSEYAIRCISDANSVASRRWRKNFLNDYIMPLYLPEDELEEENCDDFQR